MCPGITGRSEPDCPCVRYRGVVWALYRAASDLWEAGERILGAFAALLGVLVKTLPSVMLAGLIALGGVWVLNNLICYL